MYVHRNATIADFSYGFIAEIGYIANLGYKAVKGHMLYWYMFSVSQSTLCYIA